MVAVNGRIEIRLAGAFTDEIILTESTKFSRLSRTAERRMRQMTKLTDRVILPMAALGS
jgi:hypothetical protein